MTILILTQEMDRHADGVVAELARRGHRAIRFDYSTFPLQTTLEVISDGTSSWSGGIRLGEQSLDMREITSIWSRRPTLFRFPERMAPDERRFARNEARFAFGGVLRSLNCLWVNHPERQVSADYKPWQLHQARCCGFQTPQTLLTNDPDAVLRFYQQCQRRMIYKPLSSSAVASVASNTPAWIIYTTRVTDETLQKILPAIPYTACLFQEEIPKQLELRVTVIGTSVFAAEIHSQHSQRTEVDFRRAYEDLHYGRHHLPEEIKHQCLTLVQKLGLAFAALDILVTPNGQYVFLECNSAGQYGWIEDETGLPLCNALVELLLAGKQ